MSYGALDTSFTILIAPSFPFVILCLTIFFPDEIGDYEGVDMVIPPYSYVDELLYMDVTQLEVAILL